MLPDDSHAPRPDQTVVVGREVITFRLTSARTGGRLAIVEAEIPGLVATAPLHAHSPDEWRYVIAGAIRVRRGPDGRATRIATGGSLHIAGGSLHAIANELRTAARVLFVFTPGEPMERFVATAGSEARRGAACSRGRPRHRGRARHASHRNELSCNHGGD